MYKVKLHEKEYLLPANWQEVTFAQLIRLREVKFSESDGNILARTLSLSALMGMDIKELRKLNSTDFKKLVEASKWIDNFDVKGEIKKEFEFNGIKYALVSDFTQISIGELASIEQFSMDGVDKNLDKILAILIREVDVDGIVEEFKAETLDARAEVLRNNLTIPVVHGLSTFFLDGRETFIQTMTDSSEPNQGEIQITAM